MESSTQTHVRLDTLYLDKMDFYIGGRVDNANINFMFKNCLKYNLYTRTGNRLLQSEKHRFIITYKNNKSKRKCRYKHLWHINENPKDTLKTLKDENKKQMILMDDA